MQVTATPTLVRFVAVGDTGQGNSGQREVATGMEKKCARDGCDFVLLLGDNFYKSGVFSLQDLQWKAKFEEMYQGLKIPFYAILGNHDYGGNGAGYEAKSARFQVEYSRISDRWKMPARYYRFTAGNAEFFGLDTNEQLYLLAGEQEKKVSNWVRNSKATWKIVFGHHPILSNGSHGNAGAYEGLAFVPIAGGGGVERFMKKAICGQVDLYLSGHDHSRQYLEDTCEGTELVVSGAGSQTSKLHRRNAARFQSSALGFLYVSMDESTLTAEFVDTGGHVEFTRTLKKQKK